MPVGGIVNQPTSEPVQPVVAVGAIAFDQDGRVLLVRRGRPPAAGLWTVPGGRIEPGESAADACAREVAEETGLEVEVVSLAEVIERVGRAADGALEHHFVILDYLVRVRGGALAAASDATEAGWFTRQEVGGLPTTRGLVAVLERARALASPGGAR
jgi:ADP-ribose pyrophosphatase YjhB (NUDIX family)